MTQDMGTTRVYQGHAVWFEWQSPHARSRTATSPLAVPICAAIVRLASVGGFARGGLANCAAANATSMTITICFSHLVIAPPRSRTRGAVHSPCLPPLTTGGLTQRLQWLSFRTARVRQDRAFPTGHSVSHMPGRQVVAPPHRSSALS